MFYRFILFYFRFIYSHALGRHDIHSPKQTTLISSRASIYIFLIHYTLKIYISSVTVQSVTRF